MTPKEFIKSTQNDVLLNEYTLQDVIWFMTEFSKQEVSEQLTLSGVSRRLPFKEELDKMCKDYIQTTEKEDETKWHDNTMAEKVKHCCKWIKIFAKENGY
jgi:hypothetical protein